MKNHFKETLSFCCVFLIASLSVFAQNQNIGLRKDTVAPSIYNNCHRIAYPFSASTINSNSREVPNSIIKNTLWRIIIGYSEIPQNETFFRPFFRIRDRLTNSVNGYYLTLFDSWIASIGGANVYLMDVSEVMSDETVYITGIINPIQPSSDYPASIPFVAQIDPVTGNVVNAVKFINNFNGVLYRITIDEPNSQILLAGEEFQHLDFNPIETTSYGAPAGFPKGNGIIVSLNLNQFANVNWIKKGSNLMNNSIFSNVGSSFNHIALTPDGYCAVGYMSTRNPPSNSVNSRIEIVGFDINGNVMWQNSLKVSNLFSRGAFAYYSSDFDRIFVLYQNSLTHRFGIISYNPTNGNHGPLTEIYLSGTGESNVAGMVKSDVNTPNTFTVGGMINQNGLHPGYVLSPFFLNVDFNSSLEKFEVAASGTVNTLLFEDGIDIFEPKLSSYFNSENHSFSMFDLDKEIEPFGLQEQTYLFASKNRNNESEIMVKVNQDHCLCPSYINTPSFYYFNVLDSPTVQLFDKDYALEEGTIDVNYDDLYGELECGNPDDTFYFGTFIDNKKELDSDALSYNSTVIIYDVLGREVFSGKYESFLVNRKRNSFTAECKVFFVVDRKNNERKKVVFLD